MSLSDFAVKKAKPKDKGYKLFDGEGLYLWVTPAGGKHWRLKYRIKGKESLFSIGSYPDDTLAQARVKKAEAKKLIKQGIHPLDDKKKQELRDIAQDDNRFILVAGRWFISKLSKWKEHHAEDIWFSLENHIFPYIENTPITALDEPLEILEILKKPEELGSYELSKKLHQRLSAIFAFAVLEGRIKHNPVVDLKGLLKTHKKENYAHLKEVDELPRLISDIRNYSGSPITRIAMELSFYWFLRPGTIRMLEWKFIDEERNILNLPPEVMKMNQPLIVPIAKQAINLIKELHQFNGHSKYMFCQSHDPKKYMSENTVNQALKRMGYTGKQTAHGFRHIASTHLNEMGYRFDLIEKQMAHGEKDEVRAAYNKAEWIPERTEMMQTWANYIDSLADDQNNVVTGKFKTTKARA